MIRSLVFAAQNFGMAPPGAYRSALPGSDKMDGTIFIRVRTRGSHRHPYVPSLALALTPFGCSLLGYC